MTEQTATKRFFGERAKLVIRVIVSIALLVWAFSGVDVTGLKRALTPNLALATLGGALLIALSTAPQAERWRCIADAAGPKLLWVETLRATLLSYFMLAVTPSTIGADGVRVVVMRSAGASWAQTVAIILADRLYGLAAIVVLGIVGLPSIARYAPTLLVPIGTPVLAMATVLIAGAIAVRWRVPRRWLHHYAARLMARFARAMRLAARDGKLVATSLATSVIVLITSVIAFYLVSAAAGAPGGSMMVLGVFPATLLLGLLPISVNGWGLREVTLVSMMGLFGATRDQALASSLAYGFAALLAGVLGLAGWWLIPSAAASSARVGPA